MKKMIQLIAVVVGLTAHSIRVRPNVRRVLRHVDAAYPATVPVASSNATVETAEVEDMLHALTQQAENVAIGSGTGAVLVVPAGQMSTENLVAANEDMNVMSRILANALKQTGVASTGGGVAQLSGL